MKCPKDKIELEVVKKGIMCKQKNKNTFRCPADGCFYLISIWRPKNE